MTTRPSAPARFCVVVPREDGSFEAFCIACHWLRERKTKAQAERAAARHECPRPREGS